MSIHDIFQTTDTLRSICDFCDYETADNLVVYARMYNEEMRDYLKRRSLRQKLYTLVEHDVERISSSDYLTVHATFHNREEFDEWMEEHVASMYIADRASDEEINPGISVQCIDGTYQFVRDGKVVSARDVWYLPDDESECIDIVARKHELEEAKRSVDDEWSGYRPSDIKLLEQQIKIFESLPEEEKRYNLKWTFDEMCDAVWDSYVCGCSVYRVL